MKFVILGFYENQSKIFEGNLTRIIGNLRENKSSCMIISL